MIEFLILAATFLIAYANGANDNFKGVATLFGSSTADYRKALNWATVTTFAGSITAFFLSQKLIHSFSGKGLVPDAVIAEPAFLLAVILGAGLTVLFASKTGMPISTTHSLVGALAGAALIATGTEGGLHFWEAIGKKFAVPLLISPLMAIFFTVMLYPLLRWSRRLTGVTKRTCVCIGEKVIPVGGAAIEQGQVLTIAQLKKIDVFVDHEENCQARAVEVYEGKVLGISAQKILDSLHFLSAGAVSFARGLNDTPKIVALSAASVALGLRWNIAIVALVMALGGRVSARKVAETVSHRITAMNHGQGFTANLVTAFLVIGASKWGLPVSTTHVSCGALFGLGAATGKARWKTISGIFAAWVLTLPAAALLSAICFQLLTTK